MDFDNGFFFLSVRLKMSYRRVILKAGNYPVSKIPFEVPTSLMILSIVHGSGRRRRRSREEKLVARSGGVQGGRRVDGFRLRTRRVGVELKITVTAAAGQSQSSASTSSTLLAFTAASLSLLF